MSHTLPLVDSLLELGRDLQKTGRDREALALLTRLTGMRSLTAEAGLEIQRSLADLHGKAENFRKARRHLAAALAYCPRNAELHHEMASLIEADPDSRIQRAERSYRNALALAPENAGYWCDYGRYLLNYGKPRQGIKALKRALRFAGDNPELVGAVADALREVGCWKRTRHILRTAMFRNSGDRRFRDLWQQHQFAQLHAEQESRKSTPAIIRDLLPRILAFEQPEPRTTIAGKTIRFDPAAERGQSNLPLPKRTPSAPKKRRLK